MLCSPLRLLALFTLFLLMACAYACGPDPRSGNRGSSGDDDDSTPAGDDDDDNGDDDDDDDDDNDEDDDDDSTAPSPQPSLSSCNQTGAGTMPTTGDTVPDPNQQPDGEFEMHWDLYSVDANAGDCLWVKVDNGPNAADMIAFVTDSSGASYGLTADFSQLDDEWLCSNPVTDDYGCPEASISISTAGSVIIGVSHYMSQTVTNGDTYTVFAAVNGADIDLGAPVQDDIPSSALGGQ